MNRLILFLSLTVLTLLSSNAQAQKIAVKGGEISIDKVVVAKVKTKKHASLPLVKDVEVRSLKGDLLASGTYSDKIPEDPADNTVYHYHFKFSTGDSAYLPVSKLGLEKSVGKLLGKAGVLKDDGIDRDALLELIERKGATPPQEYNLVNRNKSWPIEYEAGGIIMQNGEQIGTWKDMGSVGDKDRYHFVLMDGIVAAEVLFAGGNNATSFQVSTFSDGRRQTASFPSEGTMSVVAAIDRNYYAIKRIVPWLVEKGYL